MAYSPTLSKRHLSRLKEPQLKPSPSPKLNPMGVMLIVISAVGFGTLAVFGKLAYTNGLDPLSTLSWRLGGAAAILWSWLLLKKQWQVNYRVAIAAFLLGALGYALQSALFFNALAHASAGVTALMFYTYPVFVALLSWAIVRQPINRWQAKALGIALLGSILTVNLRSEIASPLGIGLGIAAGAVYAFYMMLSARLVRNIPPLTAAAYMLLGATTTIVGLTTLQQGVAIPATSGAITVVAGLAIFSTTLPIVCLFAGLKQLDVIPTAILSTLEPVLAVAMGIGLLGEQLWLGQLLGGALIVGSALMLQVLKR
jgi:drug/metabolite transporter (DMT)-like permease